jgi:hypothetical protein
MAHKILNGTRPGDRYELIVNMKTAKALGLTVLRRGKRPPTRVIDEGWLALVNRFRTSCEIRFWPLAAFKAKLAL